MHKNIFLFRYITLIAKQINPQNSQRIIVRRNSCTTQKLARKNPLKNSKRWRGKNIRTQFRFQIHSADLLLDTQGHVISNQLDVYRHAMRAACTARLALQTVFSFLPKFPYRYKVPVKIFYFRKLTVFLQGLRLYLVVCKIVW